MRYCYQSIVPQPGMTELDVKNASAVLTEALTTNPILGYASVSPVIISGNFALGLQATVHAKNDELAVLIAATAADEEWGAALREQGYSDDDRSVRMTPA